MATELISSTLAKGLLQIEELTPVSEEQSRIVLANYATWINDLYSGEPSINGSQITVARIAFDESSRLRKSIDHGTKVIWVTAIVLAAVTLACTLLPLILTRFGYAG